MNIKHKMFLSLLIASLINAPVYSSFWIPAATNVSKYVKPALQQINGKSTQLKKNAWEFTTPCAQTTWKTKENIKSKPIVKYSAANYQAISNPIPFTALLSGTVTFGLYYLLEDYKKPAKKIIE